MAEPRILPSLRLRRDGTVEQIAAALEASILRGGLPPGSVLRESVLARQIGVSRNSVREAVRGLVPGGLVRHIPHRGFVIPRITPGEVRRIYQARELLELGALRERFAVVRGQVDQFSDRLRRLSRCARRRDWNGVFQWDRALHAGLVAALGNPYLDRLCAELFSALRLALVQADRDRPDPRSLDTEHEALIEAIRAGKRGQAVRHLRDHLRRAAERLAEHLEPVDIERSS